MLSATLLLAAAACGDVADMNGGGGGGGGGGGTGPDAGMTQDQPDADVADCPTGYAGLDCLDCAMDYQDVDGDGVCKPTCDATGDIAFSCGDNGSCQIDVGNGDRECVCDAGYDGATCTDCASGYVSNGRTCELYTPNASNLVLWLDATSGPIVRAGTDEVSAWKDRRGGVGALSLTGASSALRPAVWMDSLNNRSVVHFDGNDDITVDFPGLKGDDYTIIVVFRPGTLAADTLMRTANTEFGTTVKLERTSSKTYQLTHNVPQVGGSGDTLSETFTASTGAKLIVARRWTSGLLDHIRMTGNDGGVLDGLEETNPSLTEPDIGQSHTLHLGDGSLNGELAEVLVYDRAVEDTELAEIRDYLAAKWGIN